MFMLTEKPDGAVRLYSGFQTHGFKPQEYHLPWPWAS